jgi:hypothetical protein
VQPRAGHSVFYQPVGSVLRYSGKFGSSEIGTDRFLKKTRYQGYSVRLRYLPDGTELIPKNM